MIRNQKSLVGLVYGDGLLDVIEVLVINSSVKPQFCDVFVNLVQNQSRVSA